MKFISFRTLRSMCIDFIIFLIPAALVFLALPFALKLLMPFIAGFFLYFAAKPLNNFLIKKNLPPTLCAVLSLLIISSGIIFLLYLAGGRIFSELRSFVENPPVFYEDALRFTSKRLTALADNTFFKESSFLKNFIPYFSDTFRNLVSLLVSKISDFLINFAKHIPSFFIAAFASVFTTFFLLKEQDTVFSVFRRFFGEKLYNGFVKIKNTFLCVAASYLKAQLLIGLIIFSILLIGFLLLKINYAFLLAFFTALLDAVPVFGTGVSLIPMAAFNFLSGNSALGWGITALYGVTLLARQLCEPKIIGKSLGIHPLATVFSIYVGMKLFGIWGLIFGPFAVILIKILIASNPAQ